MPSPFCSATAVNMTLGFCCSNYRNLQAAQTLTPGPILEDLARSNPSICLKALAQQHSLQYDKICTTMTDYETGNAILSDTFRSQRKS
jgi:hypothetical protein